MKRICRKHTDCSLGASEWFVLSIEEMKSAVEVEDVGAAACLDCWKLGAGGGLLLHAGGIRVSCVLVTIFDAPDGDSGSPSHPNCRHGGSVGLFRDVAFVVAVDKELGFACACVW